MPQWMTRWRDWVRDNLFRRVRPRAIAAVIGFERAGSTRWETPVPWTADAVTLDVQLRLPISARRKIDFAIRLPSANFPADSVRADGQKHARVAFRLPVPAETISGDLLWKGRVLATIPIRILTPANFLAGLSLANATIAAQFGSSTVAVSAFVPDRCDTLIAAAVLTCRGSLAPLAELGLRVVFRDSHNARDHTVHIPLTAAQLASSEILASAVCKEAPRHIGDWWVTWYAGERTLATQRVHAIAADRFDASVRVLETRFAMLDSAGVVCTLKQPPSLTGMGRVGPCFVLTSGEAGAAALCQFELIGLAAGESYHVIWRETATVVTDGPTVFLPALFDVSELSRISDFELRFNGRLLAVASLRSVPAATLTSEGGFSPPPEFTWSAAADEELADRLKRLH